MVCNTGPLASIQRHWIDQLFVKDLETRRGTSFDRYLAVHAHVGGCVCTLVPAPSMIRCFRVALVLLYVTGERIDEGHCATAGD